MSRKLVPLRTVIQTNNKNSGTVLFLHGSGDTGPGAFEWMKSILGNFALPHIKFIFPTAPLRPYTLYGGELSNVWFDRISLSPEASEHEETLTEIADDIKGLIDKEIEKGIPLNKIIVGGFSMGGALAFNIGYRFVPGVAGVFALSSFLDNNSGVYHKLRNSSSSAPLFMAHGDKDTLVPITWGKSTYDHLSDLKVEGEFLTINAEHELEKKELRRLMHWINQLIPEHS